MRGGLTRPGVVVAGAWFGLLSGACSSDAPPRRSSDILAEVLSEASERNATPTPVSSSLSALPATFAGTVPCPDCPGIRVHLNLFEDRTFLIRTAYLGGDVREVDDIGTWTLAADRRTLTLRGARQSLRQLVIHDDRTLRQLDVSGREIAGGQAHDLVRSRAFEPFDPSLSVQGLFVSQADGGMFTECLTRLRWPVAPEGAAIELERVYANTRTIAGAEVLVELEGRVVPGPSTGGRGVHALVVERVTGAWPNRTCGARAAATSLDRTAWTLTHLGTSPVDTTGLPLAPYLELRPGRAEFAGSDGCNRVVGIYERDGDRIRFRVGAVTRIGCPDGSAVSRAFSDALAVTYGWQITGDDLELLDDRGRTLARLAPGR